MIKITNIFKIKNKIEELKLQIKLRDDKILTLINQNRNLRERLNYYEMKNYKLN